MRAFLNDGSLLGTRHGWVLTVCPAPEPHVRGRATELPVGRCLTSACLVSMYPAHALTNVTPNTPGAPLDDPQATGGGGTGQPLPVGLRSHRGAGSPGHALGVRRGGLEKPGTEVPGCPQGAPSGLCALHMPSGAMESGRAEGGREEGEEERCWLCSGTQAWLQQPISWDIISAQEAVSCASHHLAWLSEFGLRAYQ